MKEGTLWDWCTCLFIGYIGFWVFLSEIQSIPFFDNVEECF